MGVCLALHGAYCGPWVWDEALTGFGMPAVAIELRDHNRADHHARGLDHYVDQLVDTAGVYPGRPVLIGHSMGALVAQKALSRLKPAAAILLAPVPPVGTGATLPQTMLLDPVLWWQSAIAGFVDFDLADPDALSHSLFSDKVPRAEAERHVRRSVPESRRALLDCLAPGPILSAAWLGVPTLVIGVEKDPISPPATCRFTALYHGAECHIVDGAGHLMMLEPGWPRVADVIRQWLGKRGLI